MEYEFHLRAELKRAQEERRQAHERFVDAYIAMKTTHLIAVGAHDMYTAVKGGREDYRNVEQYNSDLRGVEGLWKSTEANHEAALKHHYNLDYALKEATSKVNKIADQLGDVLEGRERWEKADESRTPPAEQGGGDKTWTRTFFSPSTGKTYRFTKTFPPAPPPPPPPPPRRSSSPPPRAKSYARREQPPPRPSSPPPHARPFTRPEQSPPSRKQSPPPRKQSGSTSSGRPPLKKPIPFRRPSTTRPAQMRINNWFDEVDTALANPASLRSFPQPPAYWICNRQQDKVNCPKVALGLCACCVASMFEGRDLKADRRKFHPDKYSRFPENVRERVQRDASEVFKVVDGLYREQLEDKKRGRPRAYWD